MHTALSSMSSGKHKRKAPAAPSSSGTAAPATSSNAGGGSGAPAVAAAAAAPAPLVPASERCEGDVDFVCEEMEKRMRKGDYQTARCHLHLANCLWRDSFKVRQCAYQLARAEANWEAAAAAFMQMYADNPNEAAFYQELSRVLEGITKPDGDAGCKLLFNRLPGRLQCEILLKYGQSVGSALEQAGLMLYAIQQYPSVADQQGAALIDALLAAEQDASPDTVLNRHRKCLIVDVLPVLLATGSPAQLSPKLLRKLLALTAEFYVALGSATDAAAAAAAAGIDDRLLAGNPWPAGRQLADTLCRKLAMPMHLLSGKTDSALAAIRHSVSTGADSSQIKCLAAVTLLLLADAAIRYYRLARPQQQPPTPQQQQPQQQQQPSAAHAPEKIVGAPQQPDQQQRQHPMLLLYCLRPTSEKLVVPPQLPQPTSGAAAASAAAASAGAAGSALNVHHRRDVSKAFLTVNQIVRLIRDWPDLQRRVTSIAERLQLSSQRRGGGGCGASWFDGATAEHLLYTGQPGPCLRALRPLAGGSVTGNQLWPPECRLYYEAQCLQMQGSMSQSVRPLMSCCLALSPADGSLTPAAVASASASASATAAADARPPDASPCVAPLTCGLALRLLVATLAELLCGLAARQGGRAAPARLLGHCLVLLQRDWTPAPLAGQPQQPQQQQQQQQQLSKLLDLIRERGQLDYCPQFADYVILPEALEELTLLYNSGAAELRLFPSDAGDGGGSGGKAGVATFNQRMAAQMDRCHEGLGELLHRFVRAEEKSLLEFAEQAGQDPGEG